VANCEDPEVSERAVDDRLEPLRQTLNVEEQRYAESVWSIADSLTLAFSHFEDAPEEADERLGELHTALDALSNLEKHLAQLQRLISAAQQHLGAVSPEERALAQHELLAVLEEVDREVRPGSQEAT
jgi:hypothetical protein